MTAIDDEDPPEFSSLTFSGYTDAYIKFSSYQSKKEGKQFAKAFSKL